MRFAPLPCSHLSIKPSVSSHIQKKKKCLFRLDGGGKLGPENGIPELAGDAKAKFIIKEVMLKMVLLELLVPERQVFVVQEIVRQIVANIAKDATTVHCRCGIPAV